MATKNWDSDFMSQIMDEAAWKDLSGEFPWSEQLLEKYRDKVDWSALSGNTDIEMTCELIDRFIDRWDWRELIDRYDDKLYDRAFLERYKEYIPASALQESRLWHEIVEQRKWQIAREIAA